MDNKKCSKCGEVKPIIEFSCDNASKDGKKHRCKECLKKYNFSLRHKINFSPKYKIYKYKLKTINDVTFILFNYKNKDYVGIIDTEDLYLIKNIYSFRLKDGYINYGKHENLHKLIKKTFKNNVIDHINGNKLDNRKNNLNICTYSDNSINKFNTNNNTGYIGVCYDKSLKNKLYKARYNNKHIGCYSTPEEAHQAYLDYKLEHCEYYRKVQEQLKNQPKLEDISNVV